jgi:hypothetical protein
MFKKRFGLILEHKSDEKKKTKENQREKREKQKLKRKKKEESERKKINNTHFISTFIHNHLQT